MKHLIIYHRVDLDGVFSAAIVETFLKRYRLGDKYVHFGIQYGDKLSTAMYKDLKEVYDFDKLWILDFSFSNMQQLLKDLEENGKYVEWIDHHVSAIESSKSLKYGFRTPGVREIGKAALELTYEYLFGPMPDDERKDDMKTITLLSAYDVWDKNRFDWEEEVMPYQYGMRARVGLSVEKACDLFEEFMTTNSTKRSLEIVKTRDIGKSLLNYIDGENKSLIAENYRKGKIDGHDASFVNSFRFNSDVFKSLPKKEIGEFMVCFNINKNYGVRFGVYAVENGDSQEIAKKFGGGGHKGAAGFVLSVADKRFEGFLKTHELSAE